MANLRYGIVTFRDQRVGILSELVGGGTRFTYDPGVEQPIACAVPLSLAVHDYPYGIHPFFAHLAPEGWLRDRQSAFAEIDKDDDFGILLAFGADCIGAVGIRDPGHSHDKVQLKSAVTPLDRAAVQHERTISGVQAKILCADNGRGGFRPAGADEAAPYIAKFPDHHLPDMVANEATTMELLRILLGRDEVAASSLASVDGVDGVALVVPRFDRAGEGKLRCEDFAQVIGQPSGLDHQGKYKAGYSSLACALEHSAARLLDCRRLFRRLVAYVLLGNVDCHLKNWSLVETVDGLRLSPAYDVLNGYLYADMGYTTRFGLTIDGERLQWERYDRALLLQIGEQIGLSRRAAENILDELRRRKSALEKRLRQGLRLGEERSCAYRFLVAEAWERVYG